MKILSSLLIFIYACTAPPPTSDTTDDYSEQAEQEIWNTDLAMSNMAIQKGFNKTLLEFADDSLIKPTEGEWPVIGKKALEEYWSEKEDFFNISWQPFKVDAAKSGELGYTLGNWMLKTADTTYYGNYYTIWKKHLDGKWKWVVDGGNNTPAPSSD